MKLVLKHKESNEILKVEIARERLEKESDYLESKIELSKIGWAMKLVKEAFVKEEILKSTSITDFQLSDYDRRLFDERLKEEKDKMVFVEVIEEDEE